MPSIFVYVLIGLLCMGARAADTADAPKVQLELYYESLCPYCRNFIAKQLWPTYSKVKEILNVTLIPFGNAHEKRQNGTLSFSCQHGPMECIGNIIEACAIKYLRDFEVYFPFITCMEIDIIYGPERSARMCAKNTTLPIEQIMACSTGSEGLQLEDIAANRTESLNPEQHYVPWIVLNGVHDDKMNQKAASHLLELVCSTYTGTKPANCSNEHKTIG